MKEETSDIINMEALIAYLMDTDKNNIRYVEVEPFSSILTRYSEKEFILEIDKNYQHKISLEEDQNKVNLSNKFQHAKIILTTEISSKEEKESKKEELITNSEKLVDILLKNKNFKKNDITYEIDYENDALDINISDLSNVIDKFNISLTEEVIKKKIYSMYKLNEVDDQSIETISIITSVSEYLTFINNFNINQTYFSRGQKDMDYNLTPSIFRKGYFNNEISEMKIMLDDFKRKISFYDPTIFNKEDFDLRAYAQHYGIPTNLLDFSESHLISLLFAVEDYIYTKNHSIVIFIDGVGWNNATINQQEKSISTNDKNTISEILENHSGKPFFIKPNNAIERIHFQKGVFLHCPSKTSISNEIDEGIAKNNIKIAIIDKDSKTSILRELFGLGVNFESIYPDKDNVVKSIHFSRESLEEDN